jgi:hypothetical protein
VQNMVPQTSAVATGLLSELHPDKKANGC